MFTGIIEETGTVKSIVKQGASGKISIRSALDLKGVAVGDSIAVNGACLTVTGISGDVFEADVSEETLEVTTLSQLKAGAIVNIEKALTLNKPLGGHMVSGHVDGIGVVVSKADRSSGFMLGIDVPAELTAQMVKKGSIAVDGISLTIAELSGGSFKVAVILHTLKKTTLSEVKTGTRVNIETDVIAKYVEKYFMKDRPGVTEDYLAEHGFLRKK